ncbi:hypothetical protein D3C76_219110 [compost metagenome]
MTEKNRTNNTLNKLWYKAPASRWEEALPIGNGRIGGMVYGGDYSEVIALNEDTLWSGFPRDTVNYDALRHLKKARELIFDGKYNEAEGLISRGMLGTNSQAYQPLGHLRLEHLGPNEACSDYYRELDLETGIATVIYNDGNAKFTREIFVSQVDPLLVLHVSSDSDHEFKLTVSLDSLHPYQTEMSSNNSDLVMSGKAPSHIADNYMGDHPQSVLYEDHLGMSFEARIRPLTDKGDVSIKWSDDSAGCARMEITATGEATILLAAATDFAGYNVMPGCEEGITPSEKCLSTLAVTAHMQYDELRSRHINDHHQLFRRVKLDLGTTDNSSLPTNERLNAYQQGQYDPALEALYFQYGRYLLITSSRPGTQPAHLQGIWNPHVQPPWNSNYTTNINTEMNYWPAEVCNLSECHEPLIKMIQELSESGSRTARIHYGCRGWAAHHNVDLWRMTTPSAGDPSWAFWPMGGVWLTRHLWEHYIYNLDEQFLRETAYPIMKGAAEFCLDWLIANPGGELVTAPSTSPENRFLTAEGDKCSVMSGSTMDMFIISDLFNYCLKTIDILEEDKEFANKLKETLERMAKPKIGPDGRLLEWNENFEEAEPGHRHVSHLYGLHPADQITLRDTPGLADAARKTLDYRISHGGGHTGWSCAWLINMYARLGDGEKAYCFVNTLLTRSTYPNLFDDHPPFQIDGNFGGTAGIAEMLLQSHHQEIEFLPALPEVWRKGSVSGLKARGGYTVDIAWENGMLKTATVTASRDGWCSVRYSKKLQVSSQDSSNICTGERFWIEQGSTYVIAIG